MNNKKATKRALLTSVTALVMCVVMLAGTTFAWFTDTASTGVNKIQAGNLDVELQMQVTEDGVTKWVNAEGKTLNFTKKVDVATDGSTTEITPAAEILWEPGCRYQLPELRVVNNGNLALKYMIKVTGIDGSAKLNKVIDWTITDSATGDDIVAVATDTSPAEYKLLKANDAHILTIKGEMDKNAGNEYQGLSIDGVSVTVYATQMTAEFDSFDNLYDRDAQYPTDADALNKALAGGGTVVVGSDIVAGSTRTAASDRLVIEKPTTLNLSAKIKTAGELFESDNFCAMFVQADTTINATENGGIVCEAATGEDGEYSTYAINVKNGATLTINGGTYYGGGTAVQVQEGKLIINGGHFEVIPFSAPYGYDYMLNCIDSAYKNGTASIEVKGGTFVNFDPSNCKAEGAGTNFVAPGYKVVSEVQTNGDTWYTVVPNTVSNQNELDSAISGATGAVGVQLPAGTYTLPTLDSKDVTIIGTKDTVINMKNEVRKASSVSFEGVTVEFANATYKGFQHTGKLTYKDCTIIGQQFLYATEVEFINCTFEQDSSDAYNVWTYSAGNVLFKDCTFNCAGKSVLIYRESSSVGQTVEFQNCKFKASASVAGKAAIEIDSSLLKDDAIYKVVIDQATEDNVTGFGTGSVSKNSVWNNKSGSRATVIVAGNTVLTAKK